MRPPDLGGEAVDRGERYPQTGHVEVARLEYQEVAFFALRMAQRVGAREGEDHPVGRERAIVDDVLRALVLGLQEVRNPVAERAQRDVVPVEGARSVEHRGCGPPRIELVVDAGQLIEVDVERLRARGVQPEGTRASGHRNRHPEGGANGGSPGRRDDGNQHCCTDSFARGRPITFSGAGPRSRACSCSRAPRARPTRTHL